MELLDMIIGWFFSQTLTWPGPQGRFFFFCYVILSKMVINGQKKSFLDQDFLKNDDIWSNFIKLDQSFAGRFTKTNGDENNVGAQSGMSMVGRSCIRHQK